MASYYSHKIVPQRSSTMVHHTTLHLAPLVLLSTPHIPITKTHTTPLHTQTRARARMFIFRLDDAFSLHMVHE